MMRRLTALSRPISTVQPSFVCRQCRAIQISAAPSSEAPRNSSETGRDVFGASTNNLSDMADARFEVIGSPYSMLSVTLSPSQRLYTRRGTLVAVAGKPDDAQSTLSILNPLPRALLGVPFLYQRISSVSPMTALIATKSPTTTFSVIHLDGTTDWMLPQRTALLAWTGHTLTPSPRIQRSLSVAHWGATLLTGRGLAAVSAPGQIYKLVLGAGEEFAAHPGSVVAYAVSRAAPRPFRFQSSSLRLQVPDAVAATRLFAGWEWWERARASGAWRAVGSVWGSVRTAARRTIWGDRLFLRFEGPATVLLSSRGVRVRDVLSESQVDEIAEAPVGSVREALGGVTGESKVKVVKDKEGGEVKFEDDGKLKETL